MCVCNANVCVVRCGFLCVLLLLGGFWEFVLAEGHMEPFLKSRSRFCSLSPETLVICSTNVCFLPFETDPDLPLKLLLAALANVPRSFAVPLLQTELWEQGMRSARARRCPSCRRPADLWAAAEVLESWTLLFSRPLEQVLGYLKSLFSFYEKSWFHCLCKSLERPVRKKDFSFP